MGRHGFEGGQQRQAMQAHQAFASHMAAEAYMPQTAQTQNPYQSQMQSQFSNPASQQTQRYNTYSSSGYSQWNTGNAQRNSGNQWNGGNQWRGGGGRHQSNNFWDLSIGLNLGNSWNNYGGGYVPYVPQWANQWGSPFNGNSGVPQWGDPMANQWGSNLGVPQWGDPSSQYSQWNQFNDPSLNGLDPSLNQLNGAVDQGIGNPGDSQNQFNGGWNPQWDIAVNQWRNQFTPQYGSQFNGQRNNLGAWNNQGEQSGNRWQRDSGNQWNQYERQEPGLNDNTPQWHRLSATIQGMVGHSVQDWFPGLDPNLGCAAFVSAALRQGAGVNTHTAGIEQLRQDLLHAGYHPTTHPQPGDPIIADRAAGRPGHAAIYLGDGKIANNSSAKRVVTIGNTATFKSPDYVRVVAYHKDS